jgi:hypothetical protein
LGHGCRHLISAMVPEVMFGLGSSCSFLSPEHAAQFADEYLVYLSPAARVGMRRTPVYARTCPLAIYVLQRYLAASVFASPTMRRSSLLKPEFLDEWCRQTMRSRIEPMKKIARSLRNHRELILSYFRAQKMLSSGVVEGLNNKAKSL